MKLLYFPAAVLAGLALGNSDAPLESRNLISQLVAEIEAAASCDACYALLDTLKGVAFFGDGFFVDVIAGVCTAAGLDDADVCAGAVGLEGPIIAQAIRQISVPSRTAQTLCTTLFGLCPWPDVEPYAIAFPSPKPNTSRPPPSGQPPLQVPHFSDIHVDLSYTVGSSYNCSKPMCCRSWTTADAPGNNDYPAGPYGNIHCEAPLSLEETMYSAIETLVPNRSFSIFTGDVIESFVWGVTKTEVINDLADANTRMDRIGQVYSAVGNHESVPVNAYQPNAVSTTGNLWLYGNLATDWQSDIGTAAAGSLAANGGCYSTLWGGSKLRIISLNTNYWYKNNFWLYEVTMERDPSGLFAWLVNELQGAETAGERVWILGHMPMGLADALHDASNYFDQIIQRYDATIAAIFYGHTHRDGFQLAYSNYTDQTAGTATMVSHVAPALTPDNGSPAFKVYSVDPVTFAVLDYTIFYANITDPSFQTTGPSWAKFYSAKEAYGPAVTPPLTDPAAELTPAFFHNLTVLFENDDGLFQQYLARGRRDDPTGLAQAAACTGSCQTSTICNIRAANSQYNCIPVTVGIDFTKRDETAGGSGYFAEQGGCDGSRAVALMQGLVGRKARR